MKINFVFQNKDVFLYKLKLSKMKKAKIFIAHNSAGYSRPSAISQTGNEVFFDLNKLPAILRDKIYGKIEVIELTYEEMGFILDAQQGRTRQVGEGTLKNIFG